MYVLERNDILCLCAQCSVTSSYWPLVSLRVSTKRVIHYPNNKRHLRLSLLCNLLVKLPVVIHSHGPIKFVAHCLGKNLFDWHFVSLAPSDWNTRIHVVELQYSGDRESSWSVFYRPENSIQRNSKSYSPSMFPKKPPCYHPYAWYSSPSWQSCPSK